MRPVLFEIGSFPVNAFAVTMTLACLAAGLAMKRDFARKGIDPELAWSIVLWGLVGGLAGSRLTLALHEWNLFAVDPVAYLMSLQGMIWYGGFAGGLLATLWPIHRAQVEWASAVDSAAPGLAIGQAIGRIGCHLAGDGDWGTPTDLPWGVAYTEGVAPWPHAAGVNVHPAPIYEALALVGVFALLWTLRGRLPWAGSIFASYLVAAGAIRFFIEFVRTNDPVLLGLTEAQLIGALLVIGAAAWLVGHRREPVDGASGRRTRTRQRSPLPTSRR